MSDMRMDFAHLLGDKLGYCGSMEMVRDLPSLHAAWDGEVELSPAFRGWYLRTFLGSQEANRVERALLAIETSAREANARRHEETGDARPIDWPAVRELQRRVLVAMYPSAFEVATGATNHPADRVSRELVELGATEERWRKRYSS